MGLGQGLRAQQCNLNNVRGPWAFVGTGSAIPSSPAAPTAVPVAFLGVLIVDFGGRTTGPTTLVAGFAIPGTPIPAGAVLEMEFVNGALEVTADCTGVWKYFVKVKGFPQAIGPYVDRFIVLPDKGGMMGMAVKSPLSYPIWTWTATRMSPIPAPVSWPDVP